MRRYKAKFFVILFITAILAGCGSQASVNEAEPERATPVEVANVTIGDLTVMNEIVGTTQPAKQISVIPEVTGKLKEVKVKKGDKVEEGQALALIDDSDLRLNLQLEQTNLTAAQTQLDTALSRQRQAEDAARLALRQGQEDVQTTENLEQARIAVEQAKNSVTQAELRVSQAQMRLDDATIVSPIAGEVISIGAEEGELVSTQTPLFTIVSDGNPKINANITAEQIALFEIGGQVQVMIPALNLELTGTVQSLPKAAVQGGLFNVEISVPDENGVLKYGMAAIIRVEENAVQNTLLVPTSAIVERGEDVYVFIVEEDIAVRKPVEIVQMQSDLTAVNGDLQEGDQIVVKGQLTLSDGNKVSLMGEGQ